MSFFSKTLGKLGIGKKKEEDKPEFAGMAKPQGVVTGKTPAKPAGAPPAAARPAMAKPGMAMGAEPVEVKPAAME